MYKDATHGHPRNWHEYYKYSLMYNCTDRLGEIKQPVLLLYGSKDRHFHRYARLLHNGLANSQLYTVNEKHQIPTKKAPVMNDLLRRWIFVQEEGTETRHAVGRKDDVRGRKDDGKGRNDDGRAWKDDGKGRNDDGRRWKDDGKGRNDDGREWKDGVPGRNDDGRGWKDGVPGRNGDDQGRNDDGRGMEEILAKEAFEASGEPVEVIKEL
jgi:hypothetical protein